MKETIETTLRDLLHAINVIGEDRNVHVDGIDVIAVCPPVTFSPVGLKHFRKALDAKVIVDYSKGSHRGTYVADEDENVDEMAWFLLASLAGYCPEDDFDKWFEGDDIEIM